METPVQILIVATIATIAIIKLIADAFARDKASKALGDPAALDRRLARIEQAVEAIAIEVERVGEAQRYAARLQQQQQPSAAQLPLPDRAPT